MDNNLDLKQWPLSKCSLVLLCTTKYFHYNESIVMGSNGGLLSSHSLSYFRDPILFPFKQPTVSVIYSKNQIHRIQIHLAWSILLRFVVTYKRISWHSILYKIQNNPKIYQFIPSLLRKSSVWKIHNCTILFNKIAKLDKQKYSHR